jgi:hypothetical protein
VEFASPDPAAASPPGSCPPGDRSPRTGLARYASWEPLPSGASLVVLAGRATRVPQAAAVTSGMQRSVTVTWDDRCAGLRLPDLGWGRRPKLHGMQGVNARIDLAVPTSRPALLPSTGGRRSRRPAGRSRRGHVFKVDDSGENPGRDVRSEPSHEAQKASESALALRGRRITGRVKEANEGCRRRRCSGPQQEAPCARRVLQL